MHSGLLLALERYAGAAELGKSIDVICLDTQSIFDIVSHFLCPGLGSEDAGLEGDIIRRISLFVK